MEPYYGNTCRVGAVSPEFPTSQSPYTRTLLNMFLKATSRSTSDVNPKTNVIEGGSWWYAHCRLEILAPWNSEGPSCLLLRSSVEVAPRTTIQPALCHRWPLHPTLCPGRPFSEFSFEGSVTQDTPSHASALEAPLYYSTG